MKIEHCKDIPDQPILEFLAKHQGKWCTWGKGYSMPTVRDAMPEGTPEGLQLAKMKRLMKRGLVTGCDCGCRGDYEITNKGLMFINLARVEKMICPTNDDLKITIDWSTQPKTITIT